MELGEWRNNDPSTPLATHSTLIVRALRSHGARTTADLLTDLAGATITPDMLRTRIARLRDAGWIEAAGRLPRRGAPTLWRLTAHGRDAVDSGRPLTMRPLRAPAWLAGKSADKAFAAKAAPTAARMALPARHNHYAQPVLQEPRWVPAREGADDHLAVPSLQMGRRVPYWGAAQ